MLARVAIMALGLVAGCKTSPAPVKVIELPPNAADGATRYRIERPPPTGDLDLDGVDDSRDACPEELEEWNGDRDEDGCPEDGRSLVRFDLETGEIDVLDPFAMKVARDRWFHEEERRSVLRQIAFFLLAHPGVGVVIREESVEACCDFDCERELHKAQFLIEARGVSRERIRVEEGFRTSGCRDGDPWGPRRPSRGSALDVVSQLEVRLSLPPRP